MKKIITILLAVAIMATLLAACGQTSQKDPGQTTPPSTSTPGATDPDITRRRYVQTIKMAHR